MLKRATSKLKMYDDTELKTLGTVSIVATHPLTGKQCELDFDVPVNHKPPIYWDWKAV